MKTRDNFKGDCAPRSGKADRDKLLQQLLDQAQKSNNDKQRKSIVAKIVSIVMRTRPLCRQFNGTPLTGVDREIYDLAEQQLMSSIIQELTQNNALKLANKSRWIIILKLKHLWFKSERYSALRRRSLGSLPSAVRDYSAPSTTERGSQMREPESRIAPSPALTVGQKAIGVRGTENSKE